MQAPGPNVIQKLSALTIMRNSRTVWPHTDTDKTIDTDNAWQRFLYIWMPVLFVLNTPHYSFTC